MAEQPSLSIVAATLTLTGRLAAVIKDFEESLKYVNVASPPGPDEGGDSEKDHGRTRPPLDAGTLTQLYLECFRYAATVPDEAKAQQLANVSLPALAALRSMIAESEDTPKGESFIDIPDSQFDLFTSALTDSLRVADINFGAKNAEVAFTVAWTIGISRFL